MTMGNGTKHHPGCGAGNVSFMITVGTVPQSLITANCRPEFPPWQLDLANKTETLGRSGSTYKKKQL